MRPESANLRRFLPAWALVPKGVHGTAARAPTRGSHATSTSETRSPTKLAAQVLPTLARDVRAGIAVNASTRVLASGTACPATSCCGSTATASLRTPATPPTSSRWQTSSTSTPTASSGQTVPALLGRARHKQGVPDSLEAFRELAAFLLALRRPLASAYLHALARARTYEVSFELGDHGQHIDQQPPNRVCRVVHGAAQVEPNGGVREVVGDVARRAGSARGGRAWSRRACRRRGTPRGLHAVPAGRGGCR